MHTEALAPLDGCGVECETEGAAALHRLHVIDKDMLREEILVGGGGSMQPSMAMVVCSANASANSVGDVRAIKGPASSYQ
jgi:hypothetical protein